MTTGWRKARPPRRGRKGVKAPPRGRAAGAESRERVLVAAETLFAQRGFKGTTTRDLAAAAGLHEAILFRHFPRKEDLYRQVLERKLSRNRGTALDEMAQAAAARDDRRFFETLARGLLTRFEEDAAIPRLILHSALEGYEPPHIVTERQLRVERPTLDYIVGRMKDGALRPMDPEHAVFTFGSMLFGYIVRQHIVGMDAYRHHDREAVVESFVTIFLEGMQANPPAARAARDKRQGRHGRRR